MTYKAWQQFLYKTTKLYNDHVGIDTMRHIITNNSKANHPDNTSNNEHKPIKHDEALIPTIKHLSKPKTPIKTSNDVIIIDTMHGLDKNTQKKLKAGKVPAEATLDLHGLNALDAQRNFYNFIHASRRQHYRCIRVITGKGKGILQKEFALWINDNTIKPYIISCNKAPRHQGGSGAYYIYLRKQ